MGRLYCRFPLAAQVSLAGAGKVGGSFSRSPFVDLSSRTLACSGQVRPILVVCDESCAIFIDSGDAARGSEKFRWLAGRQNCGVERVSTVGPWLRAIAAVARAQPDAREGPTTRRSAQPAPRSRRSGALWSRRTGRLGRLAVLCLLPAMLRLVLSSSCSELFMRA